MKPELFLSILFDSGAVTMQSAYGGGFGVRLLLSIEDPFGRGRGLICDDYEYKYTLGFREWEELEKEDLPRIVVDQSKDIILAHVCLWFLKNAERYETWTD